MTIARKLSSIALAGSIDPTLTQLCKPIADLAKLVAKNFQLRLKRRKPE